MKTDDLSQRSREEVEEAARKWFDISVEMKERVEEIAEDLQKALEICQKYQRTMVMLHAPDPNTVEIRRLFYKYKLAFTEYKWGDFGVYMDGKDLSNPENIPNIEAPEPEKIMLALEGDRLHFAPVVDE